MTRASYDLVIIGNGVLGTFSALDVAERFPGLRIALVGPAQHGFSASLAAGAMHAVYGEIEESFSTSEREQRQFQISLAARALWREWIDHHACPEVVTAAHTVLFAKTAGTPFERGNYEAAIRMAAAHGVAEDLDLVARAEIFRGETVEAADLDATRIHGEFAMNPQALFAVMQRALTRHEVVQVDGHAVSTGLLDNGRIEIGLADGGVCSAERLLMTAGADSSRLLHRLFRPVPVVKGVGSALVLRPAPAAPVTLTDVVRSPNRGGAQCGVHLVPYGDGRFYVGAGNYLSAERQPTHRAETIRYLTDTVERELLGRQVIYRTQMDLTIGYRPRSLDGFPTIGSPTGLDQVFVASGTNRIGLTWAPMVAREVLAWLGNGAAGDAFAGWAPDRALISWGRRSDALEYYARSRVANLVEHGLLNGADQRAMTAKLAELEAYAEETDQELRRRLGWSDDFVIDPDLYEILKDSPPDLRPG